MERIFGTPKEPIFNHKEIGMTPDLLQEWLLTLVDCNFRQMEMSHVDQGLFRAGCATETIFLTCEKLKMSPDARYLAAEIYDRFMFKHIEDLHQHVLNSTSKQKKKDWDIIMERVRNQLHLRIVSCCQIASKLTSHYKVVSIKRAKIYLAEMGHRYASEALLQSEMRILKTLNFSVSSASTLVYVETVLEILGHNDPGTEVKMYHEVSMRVLDLVYLKYNHIYSLLFKVTVLKDIPSEKEKEAFKNVKSDKLQLAVSVIVAAVYIAEQHNADKVMDQLSKITRIPCEDIIDLASVIIEQLDSHHNDGDTTCSKDSEKILNQ